MNTYEIRDAIDRIEHYGFERTSIGVHDALDVARLRKVIHRYGRDEKGMLIACYGGSAGQMELMLVGTRTDDGRWVVFQTAIDDARAAGSDGVGILRAINGMRISSLGITVE